MILFTSQVQGLRSERSGGLLGFRNRPEGAGPGFWLCRHQAHICTFAPGRFLGPGPGLPLFPSGPWDKDAEVTAELGPRVLESPHFHGSAPPA